ncbi:hypothetical protein [Poseidonibacter ostreae]|uniref:Phage integrase SAM-like domain-containing protein n=1 Tax=Poseidonibacter ostreae TaxID=2654171 RepID=A0ABQ6VJ61_9BACT|nr:hypothetical protein [Poseidonibacter ostreae]KAB7884884.1 hypothetical protein GA417_10045 [Poseidonibacter ostreae]KAB7888947.1 hypothetical protein GBG18_11990 [Poseidonibacter ostreae]
MRGSVYYQTAELTKVVFREGAKKEHRIDINHEHYNCIASFKTMETYRSVWNNFFNYLKEHFKLKNCEYITDEHVKSYFEYKIEYYASKQYAEKISSSLGKLEFALNKYSKLKYTNSDKDPIIYDFKVRQNILDNAREYNLVADNYHNRTYKNPLLIINNLTNENHQIAAMIQLTGGARVEAVTLIKNEQLKGTKIDLVSNEEVGIIESCEKGGKVGDLLVDLNTYKKLEKYLENNLKFKINYQQYLNDLKQACKKCNHTYQSSHGLRWTFAQNRVRAYQQKANYKYYEAIQAVSWEMKHFRASITEHYLS